MQSSIYLEIVTEKGYKEKKYGRLLSLHVEVNGNVKLIIRSTNKRTAVVCSSHSLTLGDLITRKSSKSRLERTGVEQKRHQKIREGSPFTCRSTHYLIVIRKLCFLVCKKGDRNMKQLFPQQPRIADGGLKTTVHYIRQHYRYMATERFTQLNIECLIARCVCVDEYKPMCNSQHSEYLSWSELHSSRKLADDKLNNGAILPPVPSPTVTSPI